MASLLLQLTAVTKSFGAVRALEGVSFGLRTGVPGQPGGLPDISRGLSTAIRTQEEHHRQADFLEELKRLLEKNGVEYKPEYLV